MDDIKSVAQDRVNQFERSVEETRKHFDELDSTGPYKARTPLVNRFKAANQIDFLSNYDGTVDELAQKFKNTDEKFDNLWTERTEDYVDELHADLQYLINKYVRLVCHFMELEPIYLELVNHLDIRDGLEILLIELDEKSNIDEEKIQVDILDDVFACKYDEHLKEILELVESEEISSIELEYLPSRFWWRHPSEHEKWWEMLDDSAQNDTR